MSIRIEDIRKTEPVFLVEFDGSSFANFLFDENSIVQLFPDHSKVYLRPIGAGSPFESVEIPNPGESVELFCEDPPAKLLISNVQ